MSVHIYLKNRLAFDHIVAVSTFTRKSRDLEDVHRDDPPVEVFWEHRSYVLGAIASSVGFLESCINEVFANCAEEYQLELRLGAKQTKILGSIWKIHGCSRLPALSKYNLALSSLGKETLSASEDVFQGAAILIRLRNWLIHFEPDWAEAIDKAEDPLVSHRLARSLKGKFNLNPFRKYCDFEFPDRFLSASCADWAGVTAVAFTDDFFARL